MWPWDKHNSTILSMSWVIDKLTSRIEYLERDRDRLEADLRDVRSTQSTMLAVRQHEGAGLAALLGEQVEPELTEDEKRMQEEQKQFLSFLGRYQGDNDG